MMEEKWKPVPDTYNPLKAGSIDGTDTDPHDHGIVRALNARYKPYKHLDSDSHRTVFVGRLNPKTTEADLEKIFSRYGQIKELTLVRNIVTGFSKRYAFIEYEEEESIRRAVRGSNKMNLHNCEILVEFECSRTLPGWKPRRLGGGFGGKKESGQLRFGGIDRPFKKPYSVELSERLIREEKTQYKGESERKRTYDRDYKDSYRHDSRDSRYGGRSRSRERERDRSRYDRDSYSDSRKRRRSRSRSPRRDDKY